MYHITLPLVHTYDIIWSLPVSDNHILVTPIGVINFHQHHWLDPGAPFWLVLTRTCVQSQKKFPIPARKKKPKAVTLYFFTILLYMMGLKRPSLSNLRAMFSNDKLLRRSGSKTWWYLVIVWRHSCGSCTSRTPEIRMGKSSHTQRNYTWL